MTPTTEAVAESIRARMAAQQKSNRELSHLIGTSEWTASQKRRGLTPFTMDELFTVARWLGTTTDELAHCKVGV